jgi:uncharacterized OB-fold protein
VSAPTATAAAAGAISTGEFFETVRAGRLVVQRCATCGALAVPPKAVCPSCEGMTWSRATLTGDGEIASYTVIRVAPARFAPDAPYVVVVVRMAEGVSLLGRLTGAPIDAAHIGMAVRFSGSPATTDPPIITFVPAR